MTARRLFDAPASMFCALLLVSGLFCSSALAVLGVPIANMKHAEKYEEVGRFARAAEERELAAEFYHWISVPQYKEYLAYYQARGNIGQVAECEKWLRDFDEWIATCREKATENWAKVDATPAQREKSRRRVETRMIASADLYPMMHHDMLNIKLTALERKAKYPEEFEIIAESRERTARLYEAMGTRYCQHAAEVWEDQGREKDAARLRDQVDKYQEIIEHNHGLAEKARQQMAESHHWNDVDHLTDLLDGYGPDMSIAALERLGTLGQWSLVRQALKLSKELKTHERVLQWLKEKNDLMGLMWAKTTLEPVSKQAGSLLAEMPLTVNALEIPLLLDALSWQSESILGGRDREIGEFALMELERTLAEKTGVEDTTKEDMLPQLLSMAQPGLLGVYYTGKSFDKEHSQRVDAAIDFRWAEPPMEGMPGNTFSGRWAGWLQIPKTGEYELLIESDDGVRLWLDGQPIADDWRAHGPTKHGKQLQLTEGHHPIFIDYYNDKNQGVLRLLWKQNGEIEPIPSELLWHIPPLTDL